jgi:hypothetical protein
MTATAPIHVIRLASHFLLQSATSKRLTRIERCAISPANMCSDSASGGSFLLQDRPVTAAPTSIASF